MKRHQKSRCKSVEVMNTSFDVATDAVNEKTDQQPKDSQWSSLIDNIINKKSESGIATIQPLKSSTMSYAAEKILDTSLATKEPAEEILTDRTKKLIISSTESEKNSEDDHPLAKKRKLTNQADITLMKADECNAVADDDITQESENPADSKEKSNDLDDSDDNDIERGEGESVNDDESGNNDSNNISKEELKDRFYRSVNNMKVFELNLDADEGLTNIDLLRYIDELKVPKFRGVFMRDELPEKPNPVECGIVNLSTHEQMGTHWVCYARIQNTRMYFDSVGRKTPLEIQYYLKTSEEFENSTPVIERNVDIVQRPNTKICGHMCLFVLTSLMREHLPFHHVIDQLNYGYSQYYW